MQADRRPGSVPRREWILTGLLTWVAIAFLPLMSPWPAVPAKQLALVTGAALLLVITLVSDDWHPAAAWRCAPVLARIALAGAALWVLWQSVVLATMPSVDRYEGFWGNSSRGVGLASRASIAALLLVVATSPVLGVGRWIPRVVRASAVLVGIQATAQAFGFDVVAWDIDPRFVSTFGNINQASSFFAFESVLLGVLLFDRDRTALRDRARWLDAMLLVWMLTLCLRTAAHASRQGVFLLASVLALIAISHHVRSTELRLQYNRTVRLTLALVVALGVGSAVWFVLIDHGASDRFPIWTTALRIVRANWVHGVGISQVLHHWHAYQSVADMMTGDVFRMVDEVHSSILQQAAEAGVPAAVLYVGVLIAIALIAFRGLSSPVRAERLAAAGWWVYAIQDQFSPYSATISALGWSLAGCLIAHRIEWTAKPNAAPSVSRTVRALRVAAALAVALASGAVIVPRVATEVELTSIWNVGSDMGTDAASIRRSIAVHAVLPKLEPLVAARPHDFELCERAAYVSAINGDVVRAGRILRSGLAQKVNVMRIRDLYAQIELARGDPRIAVAHFDTVTRYFPTSLLMALNRQIAAEFVGDSALIHPALAHVDSLGSRFKISKDSMRTLHDRVGRGMELMGRKMVWW